MVRAVDVARLETGLAIRSLSAFQGTINIGDSNSEALFDFVDIRSPEFVDDDKLDSTG